MWKSPKIPPPLPPLAGGKDSLSVEIAPESRRKAERRRGKGKAGGGKEKAAERKSFKKKMYFILRPRPFKTEIGHKADKLF